MASDIFAKLGDIKGESLDSKHKDEIEVLSYSWGLTNAGSMGHGTGGGEGKASFHDLSFVHAVDKASPVLMQACATGVHLKEGTITHRKAGKGQQEYLIVKMNDIIVTAVQHGGSGDGHSENVSLAFAKVSLEYKPQKPDGSLDAGIFFKYNIQAQKEEYGRGHCDGPTSSGAGDMFLAVSGARAGAINGESQDSKHKNEIEVLAWSWGMQGKPSLAGGGASGKATIRELRITKRVDKASTALMSALRTNEPIKLATLTIRKVGKTPLEYLIIKIEDGRIISLDIEAGDAANAPGLFERLAFSFNKITVEYTPQGADGNALGATSFTDEWAAG